MDNTQKQMGNVSSEMESLRKYQKGILEMKTTVAEKKRISWTDSFMDSILLRNE